MTDTHDSALDYDEITDGISIGTNQCCRAHFDERLRQEGITADISLEEDRVDQPFGVEFCTGYRGLASIVSRWF